MYACICVPECTCSGGTYCPSGSVNNGCVACPPGYTCPLPVSGVYPPAFTNTYCKAFGYSNNYLPENACNPSLSVTEPTSTSNTWWVGASSPIKYMLDLGSAQLTNQLYLENYIDASGGSTDSGIGTFDIYGSNDATTFSSWLTTGTKLNGASPFSASPNAGAGVSSPEYFVFTNPGSYQYYVFDILSNLGGSSMGFRHIELQVAATNTHLSRKFLNVCMCVRVSVCVFCLVLFCFFLY